MFEIATLTPGHTLQLPTEIGKRFAPSDRFIVWIEGDILHLKRIAPSPLGLVERAPEGEPMSLEEINEIVHEVRSRRRERKAD